MKVRILYSARPLPDELGNSTAKVNNLFGNHKKKGKFLLVTTFKLYFFQFWRVIQIKNITFAPSNIKNVMEQATDIRWIPIIRLIYSDYAPLLKKLDEELESLSKRLDYRQV